MVNRNDLPREFFFEAGEKTDKVRKLLNEKLSPFYQKTMKDIFLNSLCLGFANKKRIPLDKKSGGGAVPSRVFNDDEIGLIKAIAIHEKNDVNILLKENIHDFIQITEEYANGGFSLLYFQIYGEEIGDLVQFMEIGIRDHLKEHYHIKETFEEKNIDPKDFLEDYENDLRKFIQFSMENKIGLNWWKQRIPGKIKDLCEERKTVREKILSDSEQKFELIHYLDFSEYFEIMKQKNNWEEIFQPYFKDLNWLDVKLNQELKNIRNDIAHSRPLTLENERKLIEVIKEIRQRMNSPP